MWAALVSLILGAVKWIFGGKQQAEGVAQGHSEQASQENASTAITQANVAQAEAETDHSKSGMIDVARKGGF